MEPNPITMTVVQFVSIGLKPVRNTPNANAIKGYMLHYSKMR